MTDDLPTDLDLGIDVATAPELEESELGAAIEAWWLGGYTRGGRATAPELEESELGAAIEALLLVVDTPVTTEQLAVATDQPSYRVAAKLQLMAEELTARDS